MSKIYTEYLSKLPTDGTWPDEALAESVLAQLRWDLRIQLRKRGLLDLPPSRLGFSGKSWDDDTLQDLIHEAYLYIFSERLNNVKPQLKVKNDVDALVVVNLKHFLTKHQRLADPIGYRVYEKLRSALRDSLEQGDVHVLDGDSGIYNDTVLGWIPETDPSLTASSEDIDALVRDWLDDLMPDLITGKTRTVTKAVDRLRDHVYGLEDQGVEAFLFRDVVQSLKWEVRRRWAAAWNHDAGETGVEFNDAGVREIVRVVQPAAYDDGKSFEWLLECVPNSIDRRRHGQPKDRDDLFKIWEYLVGFTSADDPSDGGRKRLYFSRLGELLGISRKRSRKLLRILRRLVEQCQSREGRQPEDLPDPDPDSGADGTSFAGIPVRRRQNHRQAPRSLTAAERRAAP